MRKMTGRLMLVVLALCFSVWSTSTTARADIYETLQDDARYEDPAFFNRLAYVAEVNTAKTGSERQTLNVERDGSEIVFFLTSAQITEGFSVCFRYEAADESGGVLKAGHFCGDWFDREAHTQSLLTPEEAKLASLIKVYQYDIEGGPPAWDGAGDPPGAISKALEITMFSDPSTEPKAAEPAFNRFFVERAIEAAAPLILKCAHPTGKYEAVRLTGFKNTEESIEADFNIAYKCKLTRRACALSLRTTFGLDGGFKTLEVIKDSAKTNPKIGLKACKGIMNMIKK